MTIDTMRKKLTELLIESDYGSVALAKQIGISYPTFNQFVLGGKRTNMKALLKIKMFLTAPPPRSPKKASVKKEGKRRMERINPLPTQSD